HESSAVAEDLVNSLNLLLDNLDIPIEIESPYDLTPSLLLAILESTLKSRLPLSDKLRTASSPQSKVEAIKVFLGVLGSDVLQRDLSSIDPRRLARGEFKEVAYVGGLLVQVAKQSGMLSQDQEEIIDVDPNSSYSDSIIDHFNQLRLGE
ncbi:9715_t:CDS:2, partial [Acaulospora colombiana]